MGIRQRREREKQEVRQGILAAAREIALQDGWQSVTIRKVAERIEYSPPTIYEYFASKDDILLELHREGFRQLAAALKAARESTEDREERLLKMGEVYWNFAMRNPELYQVMHSLGGVPLECNEKPMSAREAFVTTQQALADWAESVGVRIPDEEGAVQIIHSLLHGLVSLAMVDRIMGGEPRAKQLVQRAIHEMLLAWSSTKRE